MKIELSTEELKNVVGEEVRRIIKGWKISVKAKQSGMYKRIVGHITDYEEKLKDDLIPILKEDFGGSWTIRIAGNRMESEEVEKLKEYIRKVEHSSTVKIKKDLCNEVRKDLDRYYNNRDMKGKNIDEFEEVIGLIEQGNNNIMMRIDENIRCKVLEKVQRITRERSQLELRIYNFTEEEVPEDVQEKFKHGMDSVPTLGLTMYEVKKRVNE